jgi:hypothetical protein
LATLLILPSVVMLQESAGDRRLSIPRIASIYFEPNLGWSK